MNPVCEVTQMNDDQDGTTSSLQMPCSSTEFHYKEQRRKPLSCCQPTLTFLNASPRGNAHFQYLLTSQHPNVLLPATCWPVHLKSVVLLLQPWVCFMSSTKMMLQLIFNNEEPPWPSNIFMNFKCVWSTEKLKSKKSGKQSLHRAEEMCPL